MALNISRFLGEEKPLPNILPTEKVAEIKKELWLCDELLNGIFSFLSPQDQKTTQVAMSMLNSAWKDRFLNLGEIKNTQADLLKNVLPFISNNLNGYKYRHEIAQCRELLKIPQVLKKNSCLEVKELLVAARNQIVVFLKSIDDKDLNKLFAEHDPKQVPEFFKRLPALIKLSKQIVIAESINYSTPKEVYFIRIVQDYCDLGMPNEAMRKIAGSALTTTSQNRIYGAVALALAKQGKLTEAIEQAKKITSISMVLVTLNDIIKIFAGLGKIDEAVATIKEIKLLLPDYELLRRRNDPEFVWHNNESMDTLARALLESGRLEEALEVAILMNDDDFYCFKTPHILLELAEAFLQKEDLDLAIEALKYAPEDSRRRIEIEASISDYKSFYIE